MSAEAKKYPISAFVACQNEERNIEACLRSVAWCNEIVVVDSFSTDRTVEIARRYTDKVFSRQWDGYRNQKNFGFEQTTNEWALLIDSDERVSAELLAAIRREFDRGPGEVAGYLVPRRVFYLGRWIRHGGWYPDYKLRLVRRNRARLGGIDPHETFIVDGPVKRLRGNLIHYTYRTISEQLRTMHRYAEIWASTRRWRPADALKMLVRPVAKFLEVYIAKGGVLDGFHGIVIASMASYQVFLRYAKLYERRAQAWRRA
ncbi:MAG: glycosyltransferase family 2 protein [Verrucomicrobia bacterium]|nr:glycosyltransferase family 2 protein [Verrucomicrobiota bacterium]